MSDPLLSVKVDKKDFMRHDGKQIQVLRDVVFTIPDHELIVITGPSGCGKTTLLNLIAGLDADYHGHIELPPHPDGEFPLSYVFQKPCLLPWRTLKENIMLALPSPQHSEAQVTSLLEKMGIADAADSYPSALSLGMARRTALARAFAVKAPLLLMDEAFSSIDELTSQRLRELLLSQLEISSRIVIFLTHNLREALFLGDRLLVMSKRPSTVVADLSLPGTRGRPPAEVESLHKEILDQFPNILG